MFTDFVWNEKCLKNDTIIFFQPLDTEWHIYASAAASSNGSDNGLSSIRRQAIIWTKADSLLIVPLHTNFCEI